MQITSVTHNPVAAEPPKQTPANAVVTAAVSRLTPASVSAAVLKAAVGDGLTGAAALNDGDAVWQAARRQAIDVRA